MSARIRFARATSVALLLGGVAFAVPARSIAQSAPGTVTQQSREITSARIAEQLGMKLSPAQSERLDVGTTVNGTLADPARLARFGVTDVHQGARVTVSRVAGDRLRVEIDELDPVPLTRKITFRMDEQGELTVVPGR